MLRRPALASRRRRANDHVAPPGQSLRPVLRDDRVAYLDPVQGASAYGGSMELPAPVAALAVAGEQIDIVWRNELGGLTYRVGDRYLKWNPRHTGIDLGRERRHLEWLTQHAHPVPLVLAHGEDADAQWMVTEAIRGDPAVGDTWRREPALAVEAIAAGLRALHALDHRAFPSEWSADSWATRIPEQMGRASADHRSGPRPRRRLCPEHPDRPGGAMGRARRPGRTGRGRPVGRSRRRLHEPRLELRTGPPAPLLRRIRHRSRPRTDRPIPAAVAPRILMTPAAFVDDLRTLLESHDRPLVVGIDGPSGAGKSTLARRTHGVLSRASKAAGRSSTNSSIGGSSSNARSEVRRRHLGLRDGHDHRAARDERWVTHPAALLRPRHAAASLRHRRRWHLIGPRGVRC